MEQNKFLETLFQRAWLYYLTTITAAAVGYFGPHVVWLSPPNDFARLSLAQCLLLFVNILFFLLIKRPTLLQASEAPDSSESPPMKAFENLGHTTDSWNEASANAEKSLWQFRNAWMCVLGSWALLYGAFYFTALRDELPQSHDVKADLVLDIFNVASHAAIVACYVVLARDTNSRQRISPTACGLIVFCVFCVFEVGVVSVLSVHEKLPEATDRVILFFGGVIGIFGGMFLGLFVGQLDNEHLKAQVWLLALLFGYAAIQPLYPVLHGTLDAYNVTTSLPKEVVEGSRTILIGVAGVCKLLLCAFLYSSFTSGRLLFYFERKRASAEAANKQWAEFNKMMKKRNDAQP